MIQATKIAITIVTILVLSLALSFAFFTFSNPGAPPVTATMTRTAALVSTVTQIQFQTTTETSTFTAEPSATYATVTPSGLQLQINLNTTSIPAGGAISAKIDLINTLGQNLSLTPNWSANPNILNWDYYDYLCGLSPVYHTFSFALYQGHYTRENLSAAGTPLTLIPSFETFCPNSSYAQEFVQNIEFAPNSNLATFSANASFSDQFKSFTTNMEDIAITGSITTQTSAVTEIITRNTTVSTITTEQTSTGCCQGSSLNGYWTAPTNSTCSAVYNANSTSLATPCNFRYFTPGSYTIVAEDLWNQTVYGYFQVSSLQTPINVVSVIGPIPPYNPGGPVISIALLNVADLPIISLNATLQLESQSQLVIPYSFQFGVNPSNPLLPGQSTQKTQTLIGAGFDSNQNYPLMVEGILSNGTEFSFTQYVQVVAPS